MSGWVERTRAFVRERLPERGDGHGWRHAERVCATALRLAREEGADEGVVALAALLHDVDDWKFEAGGHGRAAGPTAAEWLESIGVPAATRGEVLEIVGAISFKGAGVPDAMRTLEGRVTQDADRLDALGAVGIARAFAYGALKGQAIHAPEAAPARHATFEEYRRGGASSVNHFYEKLFLLKDRMHTASARAEAEIRHRFMERFLERLFLEWGGGGPGWEDMAAGPEAGSEDRTGAKAEAAPRRPETACKTADGRRSGTPNKAAPAPGVAGPPHPTTRGSAPASHQPRGGRPREPSTTRGSTPRTRGSERMAISMTGFGAAKVERDQWTCTVEARSVNHRHLDLNARLPPAFTTLEGDLKKWVGDYCRRGRVDLTLNLERAQGGEGDLALDGRLALAYGAVVKEFERLTGVPVQVGLSDLLKVKDLVRAPEPPAGETFFAAMAEEATRAAMAGLRDMRRREGEALLVDIKRRLLQCGGMVGEIGKHAVDIKAAQYRRLKDNLAELEGKVAVAEDRLAQEVALYAERCDITEELTRFRAHLDHIDEMFADEEVGKRADFLLQELFREINTIASKANMAEIRHIVVEVKGELEKVREQVQNLE